MHFVSVAILLVSVISLTSLNPAFVALVAYPQQATTYTSTVAFTTVMTTTSYGLSAIATNRVTSVGQQYLYSGNRSIDKAPAQYYGCTYLALPYTAHYRDEIVGSFSSDRPVTFYVVPEDSFQRLKADIDFCRLYIPGYIPGVYYPHSVLLPFSALVSQQAVTGATIGFIVNDPGLYEFVFLNFDITNPATVNYKFWMAGSVTTTATSTSMAYTPLTQIQVVTSSGSNLVLQTAQIPSIGDVGKSDLSLIILASALILGAVAFVMYKRRKARLPRQELTQIHDETTSDQKVTTTVGKIPEPEHRAEVSEVELGTGGTRNEMFCRECGAKIPRDSKFCKECGAKQP